MDEKKLEAVLSKVISEALTAFGHENTENVVPVKVCKVARGVRSNGVSLTGDGLKVSSYQNREVVTTADVMEALSNFMIDMKDITNIDLTNYEAMADFMRTFLLVCRGFCAKGYEVNFMDMMYFSPFLRRAKQYEEEDERKLCMEAHVTGDWKLLDSKAKKYVSESKDAEQKRRQRANKYAKQDERAEGRITKVRCPNCGEMVTIENTMDE